MPAEHAEKRVWRFFSPFRVLCVFCPRASVLPVICSLVSSPRLLRLLLFKFFAISKFSFSAGFFSASLRLCVRKSPGQWDFESVLIRVHQCHPWLNSFSAALRLCARQAVLPWAGVPGFQALTEFSVCFVCFCSSSLVPSHSPHFQQDSSPRLCVFA